MDDIPVFTQKQVREMQEGFLEILTDISEQTREIRLRYANKIDVKMLLKTLHEYVEKQKDILKEDIKIEVSAKQNDTPNDNM